MALFKKRGETIMATNEQIIKDAITSYTVPAGDPACHTDGKIWRDRQNRDRTQIASSKG